MLNELKIDFIGPGVMAEAMVKGLIERAGVSSDQILMSGPRVNRLEELSKTYGVLTTTDNRLSVKDADIVVIAVKPQTLDAALRDLPGALPEKAVVLSIVAGATLESLSQHLNHHAIMRAMPNTPAQIGKGITIWTATQQVTEEQRAHAKEILLALGEEIFVEEEDYLDMATALSGTGPAYVYLFMEALVDAGVHLGFPRRIAEKLVVQTILGSVAFYDHSTLHLARLRNQVTSPGGTSAAALYYLEKAGFRTALSRAIWAAYERSTQLGKGKKRGQVEDV
ncbi:MAG: pyrroline-5-carboxylate reductase [Chloroflexi bacterium RBG_16_48_8]|nr:MAG: pyrroline-5-carboxylate reductase [Chloroflexi bacterium RBG_16_48_8]